MRASWCRPLRCTTTTCTSASKSIRTRWPRQNGNCSPRACWRSGHGFVYLPGSGLKGLTRAYAESCWFRREAKLTWDERRARWIAPDLEAAQELYQIIEAVFGWTPQKALPHWPPRGVVPRRREIVAHSGRVVFPDAWPAQWPRLTLDIVNCHHGDYYRSDGWPGDWENPDPVYFLAVVPGTTFQLPLSLRFRDPEDGELLRQAKIWLAEALVWNGAGAKTNAGYGHFRVGL